jgi:hypothetical protein
MFRKSISLLALLVLATAVLLGPGCRSSTKRVAGPAAAGRTGEAGGGAGGAGALVAVDLKLPKGWQKTYAPAREGDERQERCPASQVSTMLGVTFSSAHGCVIGTVDPTGNAAKAGLKVGDGIRKCNGGEVTCPSTLDPLMWISRDDTAQLVVVRPPGGAAPTASPARKTGQATAAATK